MGDVSRLLPSYPSPALTPRRLRPYNRSQMAVRLPPSPNMTDAPDTVRILRETLELERAATQRYAEHQLSACDPRLLAYWEGLRRNEADHHERLVAELAALGAADADAFGAADTEALPVGPAPAGPAATLDAAAPTAQPSPTAPLRERGYARTLAVLASDLEFERRAVATYAANAKLLADPRLKAFMRELVRAETGHRRGLERAIERLNLGEEPVVLYCPVCGWELDFGADPAHGARVRCPVCAVSFALSARDGDFVLERV
jgi:rubrerythrin